MPKISISWRVKLLLLAGLGIIALFIVSFISGALGSVLFGTGIFPNFFSVPKPHTKLPADIIFHLGWLPVSNTLLASWLCIIVLTTVCFISTHRLKLVPGRAQNIMEFVVEALLNFIEGVAGKENGRKFFPVIATIFLFVITNAYLSLLPGFGSIIIKGHHEQVHLIRSANTDINLPLALAIMSFICVEYWGVRGQGFFSYIRKFINLSTIFSGILQFFKGKFKSGLNNLFTGAIEAFVGLLEAISELVRMISFTFRLFGNMTAGEILLLTATFLIPWVMPVVFYGLELLVGFVQALIFGGLTLMFAVTAVSSPHSEH